MSKTPPKLQPYLRERREETTRRRLELAKLLRDDPKATNIQLAKALGVNRDTIALDRKSIMEMLTTNTMTETEALRAKLVGDLEQLQQEVEKHRKEGKLSLQAIDRMLDISKTIIELTGARKPVNEKMQVIHRAPIKFNTVIVNTKTGEEREVLPGVSYGANVKPPIADAEVLALGDGNEPR